MPSSSTDTLIIDSTVAKGAAIARAVCIKKIVQWRSQAYRLLSDEGLPYVVCQYFPPQNRHCSVPASLAAAVLTCFSHVLILPYSSTNELLIFFNRCPSAPQHEPLPKTIAHISRGFGKQGTLNSNKSRLGQTKKVRANKYKQGQLGRKQRGQIEATSSKSEKTKATDSK